MPTGKSTRKIRIYANLLPVRPPEIGGDAMTWWWLENLVDDSTLPAPCKHVLKTLCRQINPPDTWDQKHPDAWDPASDPEALMVWYDRTKLSLLTSYSQDSLSRIVGQLGPPPKRPPKRAPLTYYAVVHVEGKARQHHTARLRIALAALRDLHDPRLDALEAERQKAREARPLRRRPRRARGDQVPPAHGHAHRDEEVSQEPYLTAPESSEGVTQGTDLTPSENPGAGSYGSSASRGRILRPPFSFSSSPIENPSPIFSDPDPEPAPTTPNKKKVAWDRPQTKAKPKTPPLVETPAPPDIPITPELEAWRDENAPGLDLRRAIRKFLLYAKAHPHITNADWTAAFCFFVMHGQDQQAAQRQERQAVAEQQRAARAAAWEAFVAEKIAEEEAQQAADPEAGEWADPRAVYSYHYPCGTHHQRHAPCPAMATDTGPPPESSTFHQRYVVQTAETHGFIGLGEVLPAARNGNGHGHHHGAEDPP